MSEGLDDIPIDEVKRKDGSKSKKDKRDKKDKGYMIFEEEDSAEELFESVSKAPSKAKKTKHFKFVKKEKKERSEKKKQDEKEKKINKESKKEEKTKWKKKILSKSEEHSITAEQDEQKTVFGVPLIVAVERNPSHDGILLPAVVRECIDYISEYGLACEGIYRISGVKSKVTQLKESYNSGATVYLVDHEPNVVASLLKLFLRELPEPVLTTRLVPKFEQASATKNIKQKVEQFCQLIQELPPANRTLLSWVIVHMTHVIEKEKFNKMSLQNVSIVLSPTMKISHRVLNVLFTYSPIFFRDTVIKKYVPPMKPATSRWALDLPECPSTIEEELKKQDSLLNHLHEELMKVKDPRKEEELWEVQRVVTQLKRKLKHLRQMEQAPTKSEVSLDKKQSFSSQRSWSHVQYGHESSSKVSLESSNLELSKVQDKSDWTGLSGDQPRVEPGVKMRSKELLRSSGKKHLTPDGLSRKKMLVGEGSAKRHSSSASEKNSRLDRGEGQGRAFLGKVDSTSLDKDDAEVSAAMVAAEEVQVEKAEEVRSEDVEEASVHEVECVKDEADVTLKVEAEKEVEDLKEPQLPEEPKEPRPAEEVAAEEKQPTARETTVALGADKERDQGSSVDRRASLELEMTAASPIVDPVSEFDRSEEQVPPYKSMSEEASDSSDPYTDVAEEEDDDYDDDDDSDKKRQGVDGSNNDYEVLGEHESPSPRRHGRPSGMRGDAISPEHNDRDSTSDLTTDESSDESEFTDQAEMFEKLLEEYNYLMMEEEELLAIADETRQKIETERNEIESLQQDISELQMMRHDDEACDTSSSSSSSSSDSSGSLDEDFTTEELRDLLQKYKEDNDKLQRDNAELCEKIHQERMACLEVKVQNRMIQQKQLDANIDLIDFE